MRTSARSKENLRSAVKDKTSNVRRRQPLTDKTNGWVSNGSDSKESARAMQEDSKKAARKTEAMQGDSKKAARKTGAMPEDSKKAARNTRAMQENSTKGMRKTGAGQEGKSKESARNVSDIQENSKKTARTIRARQEESKETARTTRAVQATAATRKTRTRKSKDTPAVVRTRTKPRTSTGSPKPEQAAKKTVVSKRSRTRDSLDSSLAKRTRLSESELKRLKSARVVLTKCRSPSALTSKPDKPAETPGDAAATVKRSVRIALRKNNRGGKTVGATVANNRPVPANTFKKQGGETVGATVGETVADNRPGPANTFKEPWAKSPVKDANPLAVYEFEFDPEEDAQPKRKRAALRRGSSDSSGEEANSMKVVVKRLRRLERRANRKPADGKMTKGEAHPSGRKAKTKRPEPIEVKIQEMFDEIRRKRQQGKVVVPAPVCSAGSHVPSNGPAEILEAEEESFAEDSPELEDFPPGDESLVSHESIAPSDKNKSAREVVEDNETIAPSDRNKSAREMVEEVAQSFLEDDSPEFDSFQPEPIRIISNVLLQTGTSPPKQQIFNSTMHPTVRQARPWRLDVSAIRKRSHVFTVKSTSFTPSYDQDVIEVSSQTPLRTAPDPAAAKPQDTGVHRQERPVTQTSILDFITSSKPRPVARKPAALFDEVPARQVASPRRILGELNYVQSTPLKPTTTAQLADSLNISMISPKRRDAVDSVFSCSFLDDGESWDKDKENSPVRRNPRANLPTRFCFKEVNPGQATEPNPGRDCEAAATENPKAVRFEEPQVSKPVDGDLSIGLFEDPEDNLRVSKRITKQYVRKHPKRKRLPSIDTVDSDNESDTELPAKRKPKETKRTKAEDEEIDRLASFYNSMFEEIEQYPLCIE